MVESPPKLLSRLTTAPPRKRKRESSNELSKRWTSSGRESAPVSRYHHASPTNWRNGREHQTKIRGKPSTHTWPRSTPSLLSRMRTDQTPEKRPHLWERLSSPPSNNQPENESERRSRSSWIRYPEMNLKEKRLNSESYEREPRKKTCLGIAPHPAHPEGVAVSKPAESYFSSARTYQELNPSYELPTTFPKESPPHNGTESLKASQSISTKSSPPCTLSNLMKRERDAWDELRSFLPSQNPNDRSKREANGLRPSEGCLKQSHSFSPTGGRNYANMPNISKVFSQPNTPTLIQRLSCTINQSATESVEARTSYSPIISTSTTSAKQYCTPTGLSTKEVEKEGPRVEKGLTREDHRRKISAEGLTVRTDASSHKMNVTTNTSARNAVTEDTGGHPAQQKSTSEVTYGMRPRYLRYNIWDPSSDFSPSTSDWTLTAEPLEGPPQSALEDEAVSKTLNDNPHLFKIVTPIRVDVFEAYLSTHPNQAFVKSVCRGLREGFWPWAEVPKPGFPVTLDESKPAPIDVKKAEFLRAQRDTELAKDRFSAPFTHDLLPGMYCMPIYAVPKPHSTDLRLVTDQSYGKFSLNSMIKHDKVVGFPLDNMVHFGEMLMDLDRREPGVEKVVWKSDIAEAYRILPMHPRWQVKQINRIDDEYHVDRCNAFGGSGAGGLFISWNSLVAWIAKEIKRIRYLSGYVDDSSGCGRKDDYLTYHPYGKDYPREQVILMNLWDELGIPHKPHKQVCGTTLPIIGITVNANNLSLALSTEAKENLIAELRWWCQPGRKEKLRKWYQMGGWLNWAFNVYPRVRPALNNFYPKLKGRRDSTSPIWVNNSIREDFTWAVDVLNRSSGVHLLRSVYWGVDEATLTIYCDACPEGMGFWYPSLNLGFYSLTPYHEHPDLIFYFEALCVHSALFDAHRRTGTQTEGRFVIYTDNSNTVDIFSSLRALPPYNHLLKTAVDILNLGNNDMRVLHVPGVDNAVADALSRADFDRALTLTPGLHILNFDPWSWSPDSRGSLTFQPPRGTLGEEFL